jgi:hypothetical protein
MLKYLEGKGGDMNSMCYKVLNLILKAIYMQMNHERPIVYF